jgi:hypothetical protein
VDIIEFTLYIKFYPLCPSVRVKFLSPSSEFCEVKVYRILLHLQSVRVLPKNENQEYPKGFYSAEYSLPFVLIELFQQEHLVSKVPELTKFQTPKPRSFHFSHFGGWLHERFGALELMKFRTPKPRNAGPTFSSFAFFVGSLFMLDVWHLKPRNPES